MLGSLVLWSMGCGAANSGSAGSRLRSEEEELAYALEYNAAVMDVLSANSASFLARYERELALDEKLEGKIVIAFDLNKQGRISHRVIESSEVGARVAQCLADALLPLRFPKPRHGISFGFHFPFCFEPADIRGGWDAAGCSKFKKMHEAD